MEETNYSKYRGKCKEFCQDLCEKDPSLKMVRGTYWCPFWGDQMHWWCVKPDGTIVDPTVKQFPTAGIAAEYTEFSGVFPCDNCGKEITEDIARVESNYKFCGDRCLIKFVGLI